jgi:uncharacterized protein YhaN
MLKLKNFKLKNYRRFREKELEFSSGLNIIYGENEAGKSTISKALMTIFFADPTTRAKKFFSEVKNWDEVDKTNTSSKLPRLELSFEYNDKEYYLLKDFKEREAVLESLDGKERYSDLAEVNRFLQKLFGFTSQDVYESSGFIRHEDLTNIYRSNDFHSAIHNATAQIDSKENLHQILENIEKETAELQKGMRSLAKNPGPIKYNLNLKTELETKLNELNSRKANVRITLKNKKEAAGKIQELQKKIANLEILFENNKKYEQGISERKLIDEHVERLESDLNKIEDIDTQITTYNVKIEKYNNLKGVDLDNVINEVKRISDEIKLREAEIQQMNFEVQSITEKLNSIKKDITIYIGGAFIVLGIVLYVAFNNLMVGIVPFAGGLLMVMWQMYILFLGKYVKKSKDLKSRLDNFNSIQQTAQEKLETILEKYGFGSVEDIYNAKATMFAHASNIQNLQKLRESILAGRKIHELEQNQNKLLVKKKEINATVLTDDVKKARLEGNEYLAKKRELEMLKSEEKKQQELLYSSQANVNASGVSDEEIHDVESKLEQVELDLRYFTRRLEILEKTREFLSKAADDTAAMVSSILKKDMETYLPVISTNKYNRVEIDEKFDIRIYENAYKRWVKPESNLSSGAIDQIYFLIRLAFFKLLLKKGNLFLVLDDPFVNYDSSRLKGAIEILTQEQSNYQILLFTNNKEITQGNLIKI